MKCGNWYSGSKKSSPCITDILDISIAFTTPFTIKWAWFHTSSTIIAEFGLFGYVIYLFHLMHTAGSVSTEE